MAYHMPLLCLVLVVLLHNNGMAAQKGQKAPFERQVEAPVCAPCREVSSDVACEFGFLTDRCCCHDHHCHNPCHNSLCWRGTSCLAIRCHSYHSCRYQPYRPSCYQTLCIPVGCFVKPMLTKPMQCMRPRWTFDATTRTCRHVTSCPSNPSANLFASYSECRNTCYPVASHWRIAQEEPAYPEEVIVEPAYREEVVASKLTPGAQP